MSVDADVRRGARNALAALAKAPALPLARKKGRPKSAELPPKAAAKCFQLPRPASQECSARRDERYTVG